MLELKQGDVIIQHDGKVALVVDAMPIYKKYVQGVCLVIDGVKKFTHIHSYNYKYKSNKQVIRNDMVIFDGRNYNE